MMPFGHADIEEAVPLRWLWDLQVRSLTYSILCTINQQTIGELIIRGEIFLSSDELTL